MSRAVIFHSTKLGEVRLAADAKGRLCGLSWDASEQGPTRSAGSCEQVRPGTQMAKAAGVLDEARRQLDRYFSGYLTEFDLPLLLEGTAFERKVWAGLRTLEYGQTISYAGLAKRIGQPGKARVVGRANGANPIWLIVPCHRVIAADGGLAGYAGGLWAKRLLLDQEAERMSTTLFSNG